MGKFDNLTRGEAYALLDELYGQLPSIMCKGVCSDSCVPFELPQIERDRVAETTGVVLAELGQGSRCPALGAFGTCTVYEVRPFMCRAFGMVYQPEGWHRTFEQMLMCDHGCVPEGTISISEFRRVLVAIEELSRAITGRPRLRT